MKIFDNKELILKKSSEMKTATTKEKNWTRPGVKLTHEEFIAGIKEAEKGPFYTIDEFESRFDKWKQEKGYC